MKMQNSEMKEELLQFEKKTKRNLYFRKLAHALSGNCTAIPFWFINNGFAIFSNKSND